MNQKQVLVLDCNGQSKPALCFHLELAGVSMRVVTDDAEALNLLNNSRSTGESYTALLVNNPYLNVDINHIVEAVMAIDVDMPIVFVKESQSLKQIVQLLNIEYNRLRIYHAEPTGLVNLLNSIYGRKGVLSNDQLAS